MESTRQDTTSLLKDFFTKSFEKSINEQMMFYSYRFEYGKMAEYIHSLVEVPLDHYVDYIISNYDVSYLSAEDIVQFSNFDDCTSRLCSLLKSQGDKGIKHLEAGMLLENDGLERNEAAYVKYGENHLKTALQLGLLQYDSGVYFLSCVGYIINDFSDQIKRDLLCRLILRNKLIKRFLYKITKFGHAAYSEEAGFLKESTMNRRRSNVKKLIEILTSLSDNSAVRKLTEVVF